MPRKKKAADVQPVEPKVVDSALEEILADRFSRYSKYIIQETRPSRRPRRTETRTAPYSLGDRKKTATLTTSRIANPRKPSVTSSVTITRTATRPYTMPSCACLRIGSRRFR